MKTISIEIPDGKRAEWVDGVLTLVDEQPKVEFKFKVGDKVRIKGTDKVCTIKELVKNLPAPTYDMEESWVSVLTEAEIESYTSKDITERIKTFEDACEWCTENGHHNIRREYDCIVTDTLILDEVSPDLIAYLKLRIITCALNEGWEPRPYQNDMRYYAVMNDQCTDIVRVVAATATGASTPHTLYFKTKELALYAASQFNDIYIDLCKGKE